MFLLQLQCSWPQCCFTCFTTLLLLFWCCTWVFTSVPSPEALPAGPCSAPFAQGAGGKPAVKAQKVLLSPGSPELSSPALQGA